MVTQRPRGISLLLLSFLLFSVWKQTQILQNNPRGVLDVNSPSFLDDGLEPPPIHPIQFDDLGRGWIGPLLAHQPLHEILHVGGKVSSQSKLSDGDPQEVTVGDWVVFFHQFPEFDHHEFSIRQGNEATVFFEKKVEECNEEEKKMRETCAARKAKEEGVSEPGSLGNPSFPRGTGIAWP